MNLSRFTTLGTAVVITAIQWTAFSSPLGLAQSVQSVQSVTPAFSADTPNESLPVVVVEADRQTQRTSWLLL